MGQIGRAVATDMPGFGAADKPEHFDYSVPGHGHLDKLLALQGVRPAHLVMHDFGGPWGLGWAASNPKGGDQYRRSTRLPLALFGPNLASAGSLQSAPRPTSTEANL